MHEQIVCTLKVHDLITRRGLNAKTFIGILGEDGGVARLAI